MSDLDNNNLTNEEENSGFSPSEPDNKSFSSDKGWSDNTSNNNDWAQTNYFIKPARKMPVWPFILVGVFVSLGLIVILALAATRCNRIDNETKYEYVQEFKGYKDHHTKEIAINKNVVVVTEKVDKYHSEDNSPQSGECKDLSKCDGTHKCKPGECKDLSKCKPGECKDMSKCDGTHKCKPGECKDMTKCVSNDKKTECLKHIKSNCEEKKVVMKKSPYIEKNTLQPIKKGTPSKPGKLALQNNSTQGLYVLQVYAALSKEDADTKYEEYKARGVEKVWVSTYTNNNIVWYRVRIGDFATTEEANSKAKELGIKNYWVDRIK